MLDALLTIERDGNRVAQRSDLNGMPRSNRVRGNVGRSNQFAGSAGEVQPTSEGIWHDLRVLTGSVDLHCKALIYHRVQVVRECRDHDRRHRADPRDSQRTIPVWSSPSAPPLIAAG